MHKHVIKGAFLPLCFLFLFSSAAGQTQDFSVTATVDRASVPLGQALMYTLTISGTANIQGTPQLPDFPDFTPAGGVSSSTSISIVNGAMTRTASFTYPLIPKKTGTLTIPSITLRLGDKNYATDAVTITVTDAPQPPQGGAQAPQGQSQQPGTQRSLDDMIFVRAEVERREAYQNEGITVSYKIYTALDITQYSVDQLPTEGFWSEEYPLPPQPALVPEVINGMRYQAAEIKRLELFPTTPGELIINPMVLSVTVRIPAQRQSRRSIFDSFFDDPFFGGGQRQKLTLSTLPVKIKVKPLPAAGKPAGFDNAVGQYALSARVDKNQVSTDDAVTLTVAVQGTGNVKLVKVPDVNVSADFEVYDPNITEDIQRSGSQISGKKVYEYVLVPRNPGTQRIKPMTLAYFDPASAGYKTAQTDEIILNVTRGEKPLAALPSNLTREEVRLVGSDIRFIKVDVPKWLPKDSRFYYSLFFWCLMGTPVLLVGGAVGWRRHADRMLSDSAYRRRRGASSAVTKRLRAAREARSSGDLARCYAEINTTLYGFVADHLDVPAASLTPESATRALTERSVDAGVVERFSKVLQTCEYARFAPSGIRAENADALLDQARDVLSALEKSL